MHEAPAAVLAPSEPGSFGRRLPKRNVCWIAARSEEVGEFACEKVSTCGAAETMSCMPSRRRSYGAGNCDGWAFQLIGEAAVIVLEISRRIMAGRDQLICQGSLINAHLYLNHLATQVIERRPNQQ